MFAGCEFVALIKNPIKNSYGVDTAPLCYPITALSKGDLGNLGDPPWSSAVFDTTRTCDQLLSTGQSEGMESFCSPRAIADKCHTTIIGAITASDYAYCFQYFPDPDPDTVVEPFAVSAASPNDVGSSIEWSIWNVPFQSSQWDTSEDRTYFTFGYSMQSSSQLCGEYCTLLWPGKAAGSNWLDTSANGCECVSSMDFDTYQNTGGQRIQPYPYGLYVWAYKDKPYGNGFDPRNGLVFQPCSAGGVFVMTNLNNAYCQRYFPYAAGQEPGAVEQTYPLASDSPAADGLVQWSEYPAQYFANQGASIGGQVSVGHRFEYCALKTECCLGDDSGRHRYRIVLRALAALRLATTAIAPTSVLFGISREINIVAASPPAPGSPDSCPWIPITLGPDMALALSRLCTGLVLRMRPVMNPVRTVHVESCVPFTSTLAIHCADAGLALFSPDPCQRYYPVVGAASSKRSIALGSRQEVGNSTIGNVTQSSNVTSGADITALLDANAPDSIAVGNTSVAIAVAVQNATVAEAQKIADYVNVYDLTMTYAMVPDKNGNLYLTQASKVTSPQFFQSQHVISGDGVMNVLFYYPDEM